MAPEGEPRERVLTMAEMARLFAKAEHEHLIMFLMLAVGTAARPNALLKLTTEQIDTQRHTMATELRIRGVPVWEVAGWLGHSSGYRTTERYAKGNPEALAGALRATETYFVDLAVRVTPFPPCPIVNHGAC